MTMPAIPPAIPFPASTAASLRVLGDVSAIDIALAFMLAWLAANRPGVAFDNGGGAYDVDDGIVRQALGLGRRRTIAEEEARLGRLNGGGFAVHGADEVLPMPVMLSMAIDTSAPTRAKSEDGTLRWRIDPRLVDAFRIGKDDVVVHMPLHLMRTARSRYALQLLCRTEAWLAGFHPADWLHMRTDDKLIMRIKPKALLDDLWRDNTMSPSNLIADILEPAAEDCCDYGDHAVVISPRRVKYGGGKVGKLMDIEIGVHRVETENTMELLEQRIKRMAMERLIADELRLELAKPDDKPKKWKRPVQRPTRGKQKGVPAPAETSNVATLPMDKMLGAFAQDPTNARMGAERPPGYGARNKGDA